MEETRIYVAVAQTIQAGKHVVQPVGRQVAQACHVVSLLRNEQPRFVNSNGALTTKHQHKFTPITTIILQVRDSKELLHVDRLAESLNPAMFFDSNPKAYDSLGEFPTAVAFYATKKQVEKANLDYLPLWGSQ